MRATRVASALLAAAATVVTVAPADARTTAVGRSAVASPPRHLVQGQGLVVQGAPKGSVRYYLSLDRQLSLHDVRLIGPLALAHDRPGPRHGVVKPDIAAAGLVLVGRQRPLCGTATGAYSVAVQPPITPHSDPCPPSVRSIKLGWKLAADKAAGIPFDLAIDVNCEKVSLELGGSVNGWIGAFGQRDYNPRAGKITLFAGPKASAKIPGTSIGG
jgi:hypothetical protein